MPILSYNTNEGGIAVPLPEDRPTQIGRDTSNSIIIHSDTKVSRRHCEIFFSKETSRYIFRDLGSSNSSSINGKALNNDIVFLSDGDVINIGSTSLTFNEIEESDVAPDNHAKQAAMTTPAAKPPSCPQPVAAPTTSARPATEAAADGLEKGSFIGNYEIIRELSKGPTSTVYLANQSTLNRMVAIKIYSRFSDKAENDFLDTVQGAGALNHPNIIPYFDAGSTSEFIYLSMPFIPDGNLDFRLAGKPMPEAQALMMLISIADALSYAHTEFQITHQNIKTSNILFDEEHGCAILADIGLAAWIAQHCSPGAQWLPGSVQFTPPERTLGEATTWRADQYSLGIVLFTMLTGSPPYKAGSERETALMHIKTALPQPETVNKNVTISPETIKLLSKMTSKDPSVRFCSWLEVIEAAQSCSAALDAFQNKPKQASPIIAKMASMGQQDFSKKRSSTPPLRITAARPSIGGGVTKQLSLKKKI